MSQEEALPPTTVVHSSLPLGGIASSHKKVSVRHIETNYQQQLNLCPALLSVLCHLKLFIKNIFVYNTKNIACFR